MQRFASSPISIKDHLFIVWCCCPLLPPSFISLILNQDQQTPSLSKMGCRHKFISCHRHCRLTISFFFFLIIISFTPFTFTAQARHLKSITTSSQVSSEEEKIFLRALIGSRPPRCERRCNSCAHCEAIQVPANQQVKIKNNGNNNNRNISSIAYSRGDDSSSNYKPMSWKCKCGNFIFNP